MEQDKQHVLSFEQERLWFLDRMDPGNPAYNRICAFKLSGKLNRDGLTAGLQAIFRRHDTLRACFPSEQGRPYQIVRSGVELEVRVAECTSSLPQQIAEETNRPFNLAEDILVRALLIRLTDEEAVLILTFHHIIFDGWSLAILRRELASLYTAFVKGVRPDLKPLPAQYTDYAARQRQRLTGPVLEEGLRYWRQQLCGPLPEMELPFRKTRPAQQTFAGASVTIHFSADLLAAIRQFCRQERLTPFMVFVAALQALLYRYTGQTDCIISSMASGRTQQEIEPLIGLFVNTLVIRSNLAGNPTFRELAAQVKTTVLEAYNHQEIPFAKLVAELNPQRTLNRPPFAQILINMHNMPQAQDTAADLAIEEFALADSTASGDLTVKITERNGAFTGLLIYNTDLFEREMMERMAGHMTTLLQGAVDHPDTMVSALPLLSGPERDQLVCSWNGRTAEYPRAASLVQLFEEQVERFPDAIAISYRDDALSYRELNRQANQLAHYLVEQGVVPGSKVGVCLERSPAVIRSFLAVLKAGGTYVPLDPAYPTERLSLMAETAQISLLITDTASGPRVRTENSEPLLLDGLTEILAAQRPENPARSIGADHAAYIMFTSGSTGRPKAVSVTHRGVARLVKNPDFDFLGPDQVFLQLAAVAFDFSTFEIYGALLNGARLAIIDADLPSLEQIGETLRQHGVTTFCGGPELLTMLLKTRSRELSGVRQVLSGGEVLPPALVTNLQQIGCRVVNIYGPTENTVCTTMFSVPDGWSSDAVVPIGRPIANDYVYILDPNHQLVPIGVPGALFVGGDGLTSGYVNQPNLTRQRFIANPFPQPPGSLLYNTGDIVKWLPDGTLAFLGRCDNQVKVRGCRIELGEIEAILGAHPELEQVHVAVQQTVAAEKTIVAYVMKKESSRCDAEQLRTYLRTKLPAYMLPAAFMFLDSMPLTPVGKIDKAVLPVPQFLAGDDHRKSFATPRGERERAMVELWERLLERRPIGIRDGFFELGGHSLLAMRLMADIEKRFGERFPVSLIFTADTVEKLCGSLSAPQAPASSRLVPIRPQGAKPPLFCIHSITGEVVSYRNLLPYLDDEQPVYGLAFDFRTVDQADLTIHGLAARYIQEIQTVDPQGPYYLLGHSLGGLLVYEMAQQLWRAGYSVALLAIIDTANPNVYKAGHTPFLARTAFKIRRFLAKSPQVRKEYLADRWHKLLLRLGTESSERNRLKAVKKTLRAAFNRYRAQPYPGHLVLFRALDRERTALAQDTTLGWKELIRGRISLYENPHSHAEIIDRKNIGHFAVDFRICLAEAQQTHD